jgi:hypothetical protein
MDSSTTHLIKKIEKKFGPLVKSLQQYKTPGTPGGSILRNPNTKIEVPQQKLYRSGVCSMRNSRVRRANQD